MVEITNIINIGIDFFFNKMHKGNNTTNIYSYNILDDVINTSLKLSTDLDDKMYCTFFTGCKYLIECNLDLICLNCYRKDYATKYIDYFSTLKSLSFLRDYNKCDYKFLKVDIDEDDIDREQEKMDQYKLLYPESAELIGVTNKFELAEDFVSVKYFRMIKALYSYCNLHSHNNKAILNNGLYSADFNCLAIMVATIIIKCFKEAADICGRYKYLNIKEMNKWKSVLEEKYKDNLIMNKKGASYSY